MGDVGRASTALLLRAREERAVIFPVQPEQQRLQVLAAAIVLRDGRYEHLQRGPQIKALDDFGLGDSGPALSRCLKKLREADQCPHRAELKKLNRRLALDSQQPGRVAIDNIGAGMCLYISLAVVLVEAGRVPAPGGYREINQLGQQVKAELIVYMRQHLDLPIDTDEKLRDKLANSELTIDGADVIPGSAEECAPCLCPAHPASASCWRASRVPSTPVRMNRRQRVTRAICGSEWERAGEEPCMWETI